MSVLMSGQKNKCPLQGLSNITKRIIIILNRLTCKKKMQKIVNVLALASAAVSLAVVGTAGYVFVNKDAIIQGVTDKAMESVLGGGLGGLGSGALDALPAGANDLSPAAPQASNPSASIPDGVSSPF